MTNPAMNSESRTLAQFHALLKEFRAFRNKEDPGWGEQYEKSLTGFFKKLCVKPGTKSYFASVDNSFAYLSPDIVHEIVDLIDDKRDLGNLVDLRGIWRHKARLQWNLLGDEATKRGNTVLGDEVTPVSVPSFIENRCWSTKDCHWFDRRMMNFLHEAPTLHGRLKLSHLCAWGDCFCRRVYKSLKPRFRELDLSYHPSRGLFERTRKIMKSFLVQQLRARHLRSLSLNYSADFGLEEELKQFCLSDRFDYLNWNCRTLSVDFFVQIYNAFKALYVPDGTNRRVEGLLEPAALDEFVQTLRLTHTNELNTDWYKRDDASIRSVDYYAAITVGFKHDATVCTVAIVLEHREDECESAQVHEEDVYEEEEEEEDEYPDIPLRNFTKRKVEGVINKNDDCDVDYDDGTDEEYELECNNSECSKSKCNCVCLCEYGELNENIWLKEDCRYCSGCKFCRGRRNSYSSDCSD